MDAKISLRSVSKSYKQEGQAVLHVFDHLSVDFVQGQSYAIMGASGSGKSTLIHLIAGIDEPTSGNIFFSTTTDDQQVQLQNIFLLNSDQKALYLQKNISIVFQQSCLFVELTVLENVMLKEILAGGVTTTSYEHARNLLQEIGLLDKADAYPAMLSGGQQQCVAILRAIFVVPQFLLVDEPTGNLDEKTGEQVIDLLLHYHKKYNMGLIVSTHSQQIAHRMQTMYRVCNKKLDLMSL